MRLDTESLRALKLVVETGNISTAAERLSLTQSAVSWKLRRLEERLGHALLRREGRVLRPTQQGQELIEYADRILSAHDAAVQWFRGSALTGSIRLGTTDDVATSRVAGIAGRFRWAHPGIQLQVRVASSLQVADWLEAGDIDLAVMPVEQADVKKHDFHLWSEALQFVQATETAFSDQGPLPIVTFGSKCFYRQIATGLLDDAGIAYEEVLQSASIAGVRAAVSAGFGVALMNESFMTADQCHWVNVGAVESPPTIHYVLRAAKQPLTAAQQSLVAELSGFVPVATD